MEKLIIWIIIFAFVGCTNQKYENSKPPVKLIIFADKTGSISNNSIPKLEKKHLEPIIDYINEYGGEFALSDITRISKQNLIILRNIPRPILKQGETAEEFSERISEWKKSSKSFNKEEFFLNKTVQSILDYSNLADATNIADAVDLANLYLNTENIFFQTDLKKIAVFVTDGEDNMKKKLPQAFCCELYMVSRSSDYGSLTQFSPIVHPTIDGVFEEIINK
jgi:hypothetical protein